MNGYIKAALFGYALGLLTAPKKGKVLRGELKDQCLNLQKAGVDAMQFLQDKGQELVETAAPAVEQVKLEGQVLKEEGEDIAKNAQEVFQEAYDRSLTALQSAEQRIKEKAAPAIALVKEDANLIKNQGSELYKNAAGALSEVKEKAMPGLEETKKSEYGRASSM